MSPRKVNASDVLAAIEEHKKLGREKFLEKYGFSAATKYLLDHEGQLYDSKAIYGVARIGAGHPEDKRISGGKADAAKFLEEVGFSVISKPSYWWVNHKQTSRQEIEGGFLWSPVTDKTGRASHFYENMKLVQPGDFVFSYANTKIGAIGVCTAPAMITLRPEEFGAAGNAWLKEGWKVPIVFTDLENPLRPKNHMDVLKDKLPKKYSPIQSNGNGNQGAYLASVPQKMADVIIDLLEANGNKLSLGNAHPASAIEHIKEEQEADYEDEIRNRTDIGATEKQQLVRSRRGQGQYRKNLQQFESSCRVTGTTNLKHLRASHIKPWRSSSSFEKLDGNNGLLLAPHIDHLFDQGYISFDDEGCLLISEEFDSDTQDRWHVDSQQNTEPFRAEQHSYLKHHREEIFRGPETIIRRGST